jgi:hypothetical protein
MYKLKQLIEIYRKQFLNSVDPSFIHHKQRSQDLPRKNIAGAQFQRIQLIRSGPYKQVQVIFWTGSATEPGNITYVEKVILEELFPLLKAKKSKMSLRDKVIRAVNYGDLKIGCQKLGGGYCPSSQYYGYNTILTRLGAAHPDVEETIPSPVRNPQGRGICCKHLDLCLKVLPFHITDIVKGLKELGYD